MLKENIQYYSIVRRVQIINKIILVAMDTSRAGIYNEANTESKIYLMLLVSPYTLRTIIYFRINFSDPNTVS